MKFESEKFSIRAQDTLTFNAILSEVYFILYDKFVSFLPFYGEILDVAKQNPIKKSCIEELNKRDIPEKILDIYLNNVQYFNDKYSINENMLLNKKTVQEKGDLILEKIIDDVKIEDINTSKKKFLKDVVFGSNNQNIIECPIIVQNVYGNSTDFELFGNGTINSDFYKLTNLSSFKVLCDKPFGTDIKIIQYPYKYYFDKKYLSSINSELINTSGFHFESFLSFDFDVNKFLKVIDVASLTSKESDGYIDFETFMFSCLNSSLFLTNNKDPVKDIKINAKYFQKIFPIDIQGTTQSVEQYTKLLSSFPLFITNIRHGLRLVWKNSNITEGSLDSILDDSKDIVADNFLKKKAYVEYNNELFKRLSNRATTESGKDKTVSECSISSLEYNIIKEKSYILHFEVGQQNNKKKVRTSWVPICSVYSNDFSSEKFMNNPVDFNIKVLHEFINDKKYVDILKEKIINEKDFLFVFEKLIPLPAIFTAQKINTAISLQNKLNSIMAEDINPDNASAKSLQIAINNTLETLLKDQKEY
jgi:hypothetical protein